MYNQFRTFDKLFKNFEEKAANHSEISNLTKRRKMMETVKQLAQFYKKNEYIDNCIEFDQRFFNSGY